MNINIDSKTKELKLSIALGQEKKISLHKRETVLLHSEGKIFLKYPQNLPFSPTVLLPQIYAAFQLESILFLCGHNPANNLQAFPAYKFQALNQFGQMTELPFISYHRSYISLSGAKSFLVALGGRVIIKPYGICQAFSTKLLKWKSLPSLEETRFSPGSCVLQNQRVFSFCGNYQPKIRRNAIETLQIGYDTKWTLINLSNKKGGYDLAACQFRGAILIFGGAHYEPYSMQTISQEGQILIQRKQDPIIPGSMGSGSVVSWRGNIYAIGDKGLIKEKRKEWQMKIENKELILIVEGTQWRPQVFNGESWGFL